jgi:hypothetical protein
MDRLEVPGGAEGLRQVANAPIHVTDEMVLVEVARAWYGIADPLRHPSGGPQRLIQYLSTSPEPPSPGPATPLPAVMWIELLDAKRGTSPALALVSNRDAMLLYHGLMGMSDDALKWIAARRNLLSDLLSNGAAAFSTAAAAIRIVDQSVVVPGGPAAARAWEDLVGAPPSEPEEFIRRLMRANQGRLAWMFDVLSSLDGSRQRFAVGASGEHLGSIRRHFELEASEWTVSDRPFLRPSFDASLPLLLIEPPAAQPLFGSRAFWEEVFRTDDLEEWRETGTDPLTASDLLDVVVGYQPYGARERWVLFSFAQRVFAGVEPSREAGLLIRAAQRFPALAVSLRRSGVRDVGLYSAMFRAAERVTRKDPDSRRGDLSVWQAALAIVETSWLRGGFDRAETEWAYRSLAALPGADPRVEVTDWLAEELVPKLLARKDAPSMPEGALLQTMAGALTGSGARVPPVFEWEEMPYAFVPHAAAWRRMEAVRAAQEGASLDDAMAAWRAGTKASREKAAGIVARVLPAIAYAPHQAASETPALGADLPFRHEWAPYGDGPLARRRRPWLVPAGDSDEGGWRLLGSLLSLDLAVSEWYVNRHGELPPTAPGLDDPDILSLSLTAALASAENVDGLDVESALAALDRGRAAAERLTGEDELDAALERAQVDPWRRRALRFARADRRDVGQDRGALTLSEIWQLGGGEGSVVQRWALEGCPCFGPQPRPTALLEGRRATGLVGAVAADGALRVASFLRARGLPLVLFGAVYASAVVDVIHGAEAMRPDDRLGPARAATEITDARLEEHMLALISSGALARP